MYTYTIKNCIFSFSGTFNHQTGQENITNCLPCLPGYYCPRQGIVQPTLKCTAGYWCMTGSPTPTPVDSLYGTRCPNGSYCPEGTPRPINCPAGSYQPVTGKTSSSDCLPCDPGMYCERSGLYAVTAPCNPGFFCIANATTNEPRDGISGDICPIGHYCTEQTSTPHKCLNGTFMNHTGNLFLFKLQRPFFCGMFDCLVLSVMVLASRCNLQFIYQSTHFVVNYTT